MLRHLSLLVTALALASCTGALTKDDCTQAGESGTWDVSFALSSGDSTKCPTLEKSLLLPNGCETSCGCTEATVVFVPAPHSATVDTCSLRFHELCPSYELDCRDVELASASLARGDCFYRAGADLCSYRTEWVKQQ